MKGTRASILQDPKAAGKIYRHSTTQPLLLQL